jgi:hypothetical protein
MLRLSWETEGFRAEALGSWLSRGDGDARQARSDGPNVEDAQAAPSCMGKQPGTSAAAGNHMVGGRRGHDRIVGPAGQLCTDVSDDLEPARHVIERFGDVLGDPTQRTAAGGAGTRRPRASPPLAVSVSARAAAPTFAPRLPPRSPRPPPARRQRVAQPDRLPALRSPTGVGPPRAPASRRNGRPRLAGT